MQIELRLMSQLLLQPLPLVLVEVASEPCTGKQDASALEEAGAVRREVVCTL